MAIIGLNKREVTHVVNSEVDSRLDGMTEEIIEAVSEKVSEMVWEKIQVLIENNLINAVGGSRTGRKSGHENGVVTSLKLNYPRVPKTTYGIPENVSEIRQEIKALVSEMSSRYRIYYGRAYNKGYEILFSETGFDVKSVPQSVVGGKENILQTVIDNGKGKDLIRVLRNHLNK